MFLVLLLAVLAQPPKAQSELPVLRKTHTAFPSLALPDLKKDGKVDLANYEKELAERVFTGFLPKLAQDATPLQKVQHEQVREGFTALKKLRQTQELCRWDSAYDSEYLVLATELHRVAAELYATPAEKIRCYEARIILLKDFERHTEIRIDLGQLPPHKQHTVCFARLQAEADLLKLKDSLKDKK